MALLGMAMAVMPSSAATIRVAGGYLRTAAHISATNLIIDAEATLCGTGTIHAATTIRGVVNPGQGTTAGTLSFSDSIAFDNGRFLCDAEDSTTLDQLSTTGQVSGVATVVMVQATGAYPIQQVIVEGAPSSDYSSFAVSPAIGWRLGESGSLDLWVSAVPEMAILGTNGVVIANGAAPQFANGSRFTIAASGAIITHTFAITNNGLVDLTISSWITNSDIPAFSLAGIPTTISAGMASNVDVVFSPSAGGAFTALVSFANNSLDTPYVLNLAGSAYAMTTNIGPHAGGNSITITNGMLGDGSDITNVLVGGVAATITGQGADWVTITLGAASSAGAKDIVIQSASVGETTLVGAYTYNPAGDIGAVSPGTGSITGGYEVVIGGSNLCDGADATNVTLCGISAASITSQSATQIVVVAGVGSGAVTGDVRVFSTSYGETVMSDAFEYTVAAPVLGPVTLWRATNQVLKVTDLMLMTNSVDPQSSTLTVVMVSAASTNGGTVALTNHWVTYNPPVGDDTPDFFMFRVQNALGAQADGTAEVIVITPATEGQTMNISSVAPSASNTLVRFVGIPGRGYDVQSTTNLVETPWMKIGDITIGAKGYVIFTDTNEPAGQFYRTARPE